MSFYYRICGRPIEAVVSFHRLHGTRQERPPGRGQHRRTTHPIKEDNTELLLERFHLYCNGRLGSPNGARGSHKRTTFSDCQKSPKFSNGHGVAPSFILKRIV